MNKNKKEKNIIKLQNLLQVLTLTLGIVFLAGCGGSLASVEPTATLTPEPATANSVPATPTPIPPTPTPEQAISVVFNTPEEAIAHYFEGLAQADPDKILQACAIDEMSENFNFDLNIERMGLLLPTESLSPTEDPFYVEANKMQLSAQIFTRVKMFAYSLLSSETVDEGMPIQMDPERTANFVQDINPERLARLEVKQVELPDETLMNSDRYLENSATLAGIYGADELTERVVLFSFEENDYLLGFTLLRYDDTWKISSQTSPLAGTSAQGTPQQTSVEEFESMINGD